VIAFANAHVSRDQEAFASGRDLVPARLCHGKDLHSTVQSGKYHCVTNKHADPWPGSWPGKPGTLYAESIPGRVCCNLCR
jgi:hypothetical protein